MQSVGRAAQASGCRRCPSAWPIPKPCGRRSPWRVGMVAAIGWSRSPPAPPSGTIPVCPSCPLRWVLVRDPAAEFEPQAFLCTDLRAEPADILTWFVRRWTAEVTFAEARRHLGVETQRQWSDKAIARTTPALLGLYPIVALAADDMQAQGKLAVRSAGWYQKDTSATPSPPCGASFGPRRLSQYRHPVPMAKKSRSRSSTAWPTSPATPHEGAKSS